MVFPTLLIPKIRLPGFACTGMVLFCCFKISAFVATNWVSPSGNNTTGNGTATNPYATLQKAIDVSAHGDLIILKSGNYAGVGNQNLTINKALTLWSEAGPGSTTVNAGRQRILTSTLSGTNQSLIIRGLTFTNGYLEFNGDWNHDSLIRLNAGSFEFRDCVFRQNEVKATYVTSNLWLVGTASGDANLARVTIRNSLFHNNTMGCGGWVNSIGGGGGAIFWAPGNSLMERCTVIGNSFYSSTSGNGSRYIAGGGRADSMIVRNLS